MNTKFLATLTAMLLATGLSQPVTNAQASQLFVTSMLNDALVQRSSKSPVLNKVPSAPPDRGAPGGRRGGASRVHLHL